MSQTSPYFRPSAAWEDDMLTRGTMLRRLLGFLIDGIILLILWKILLVVLLVFGVLSLGLGMPLLTLLPVVPPLYNWLALLSPLSATPGQAMMGLIVRRNDDMGPPGAFASAVWVGAFYVSVALSGLPLLTAVLRSRRRTLHDIIAGLAVVRRQALTPGAGSWNMDPGGSWRQ